MYLSTPISRGDMTKVPYDFNRKLTSVFFPPEKITGLGSQTSFILSNQSWETGSPLTGNAGRITLSCVMPASIALIWDIHTSWREIIHLILNIVSVCRQFILVNCSCLVSNQPCEYIYNYLIPSILGFNFQIFPYFPWSWPSVRDAITGHTQVWAGERYA